MGYARGPERRRQRKGCTFLSTRREDRNPPSGRTLSDGVESVPEPRSGKGGPSFIVLFVYSRLWDSTSQTTLTQDLLGVLSKLGPPRPTSLPTPHSSLLPSLGEDIDLQRRERGQIPIVTDGEERGIQ